MSFRTVSYDHFEIAIPFELITLFEVGNQTEVIDPSMTVPKLGEFEKIICGICGKNFIPHKI